MPKDSRLNTQPLLFATASDAIVAGAWSLVIPIADGGFAVLRRTMAQVLGHFCLAVITLLLVQSATTAQTLNGLNEEFDGASLSLSRWHVQGAPSISGGRLFLGPSQPAVLASKETSASGLLSFAVSSASWRPQGNAPQGGSRFGFRGKGSANSACVQEVVVSEDGWLTVFRSTVSVGSQCTAQGQGVRSHLRVPNWEALRSRTTLVFNIILSPARVGVKVVDATAPSYSDATQSEIYYSGEALLAGLLSTPLQFAAQFIVSPGSTFIIDWIRVSPLQFVPLPPCRVLDTRLGPAPLGPGQELPLEVTGNCGVPLDAVSLSLNVTVVPLGPLAFLTLYPQGFPRPLASTLNSFEGRVVANAATVPAGMGLLGGAAITCYVTDTTHLIIDINGYYSP